MAGSYRHVTDENNRFLGVDLLDNLGDAYEALEECYMMIKYLSGGDTRKIHEAWLEGYIKASNPDRDVSHAMFSYERFWKH